MVRWRAACSRRSMRSSRAGSSPPGTKEFELFILAFRIFCEILVEILIEFSVRTQTAHLLVLVTVEQGTQGSDLVAATEENGNEAAGGEQCPAHSLARFQSFRENQARTHETQKNQHEAQDEERCSQCCLQTESRL